MCGKEIVKGKELWEWIIGAGTVGVGENCRYCKFRHIIVNTVSEIRNCR